MTQFLPPNLLALFAPREKLPYLPSVDKPRWLRKPWPYTGVGAFLHEFEDPKDTPPPTRGETKDEKIIRKRTEKSERIQQQLEEATLKWDPHSDANAEGDAFKTLFVGRINYDTSESKLRREMETYGPIKHIHMVCDKETGKPRGYAFIEYEHERDMHAAYKYADGKKIDGRRIVVDVERGRTVKSWLPRRLGGGLGGTRRGGPDVNVKHSGRVDSFDESKDRDQDRGDRDRDRDRERERVERDRDRERNERERDGERERNRDRERDRGDRTERDRGERSSRADRDRDRGRDKDREREKRRHRSRSRDKDRERDRSDRDRKRDRGDRDRDRDRGDRDRDGDKERDRDMEKERDRNGERERGRDNERDRDGENERGNERDRDVERERDRIRDHDSERIRDRENERDYNGGKMRDHDHYEREVETSMNNDVMEE